MGDLETGQMPIATVGGSADGSLGFGFSIVFEASWNFRILEHKHLRAHGPNAVTVRLCWV